MLKGWLGCSTSRKIILYDISFNLESERVFFHPLSSHSVKEKPCFGCCCVGFVRLFCPIGAFEYQKHVEEVSEVSQENWQFLNFVKPTLSNLPPATIAISNLITRWRSSTLDSCNTFLISPLKGVLKVCKLVKYIFTHSWLCIKVKRYPDQCFSKHYITQKRMCFSVLWYICLKNLISDGPSILVSSCSQACCWTWHREK